MSGATSKSVDLLTDTLAFCALARKRSRMVKCSSVYEILLNCEVAVLPRLSCGLLPEKTPEILGQLNSPTTINSQSINQVFIIIIIIIIQSIRLGTIQQEMTLLSSK